MQLYHFDSLSLTPLPPPAPELNTLSLACLRRTEKKKKARYWSACSHTGKVVPAW